MFPDGFINRIKTQEYIDADNLLKALQTPSPSSIRINPAKWDREPMNASPVTWCDSGFYLHERPSFTLDPLFHAGCYYPQEASGMFIEQVLKQVFGRDEKYLKALDLCGAPGGKSTHLSSLIGSRGLLVANDVIRSRAVILAENITKWGKSNTLVTQNDPSAFSKLTGFFDIILVDAPCSGEGMFRDSVAVKEWSVETTFHCSERQRRILNEVWPSLREDGILIYSTCTFNPGENEENIKWLLTKYSADIVDIHIADFNGITEIGYQGTRGYGFYPGRIKGDGLYISVVRKKESHDKAPVRIRKEKSLEVKKRDKEIIKEWTDFPSENIVRKGDGIFSVAGLPEDYHIIDQSLKIISHGTRICMDKKNGYVPCHDLALSENIKKDAFAFKALDYQQALAYLRRDNLVPEDIPGSWFVVTYKGVNLGFCNNIGNRVNNYYPVDWRIRMQIPDIPVRNIVNWDTK